MPRTVNRPQRTPRQLVLALVVSILTIFSAGPGVAAFAGPPKFVWHVPILAYHWTVCPTAETPPTSAYLYVCPETFRGELQLLLDNGWTFITGAQFAAEFKLGLHPAPRTAVITIDGTDATDYQFGFPVLRDLGLNATFFISPGLLERSAYNETWAEIEEMAAAGQDIESHGMYHKTLTWLHGAALTAEISAASDAIEAHLGYRPSLLCYANGKFNDEVRTAARSVPGLRVAAYSHAGVDESSNQPMQWHRVSVRGEYTPEDLLDLLEANAAG